MRGLTQVELAEAIGRAHGTIGQMEVGKTSYVQSTLEDIARVLHTTPADIIARKPGPIDENPAAQQLIDLFLRLDEERQRNLIRLASALLEMRALEAQLVRGLS